MQYIAFIDTPIGILKLTSSQIALISISFDEKKEKDTEFQPDILTETKKQLREYFAGTRKDFTLNLEVIGTDFQKEVWKFVEDIPFGLTASYLDIAVKTGSKTNTRAVGMVNGKNPIPIIIPCHRVIGTNGKLTGYAGGLERKRWLLQHELKYSEKNGKLF